jgi:hypothetical protein
MGGVRSKFTAAWPFHTLKARTIKLAEPIVTKRRTPLAQVAQVGSNNANQRKQPVKPKKAAPQSKIQRNEEEMRQYAEAQRISKK